MYDVIIDLRPESSTYKQWISVKLSAENYKMLYVPKNFAQAFLTLEDNSELLYLHTAYYAPSSESACSIYDPLLNIDLPIPIEYISERDKNHSYVDMTFKGIEL